MRVFSYCDDPHYLALGYVRGVALLATPLHEITSHVGCQRRLEVISDTHPVLVTISPVRLHRKLWSLYMAEYCSYLVVAYSIASIHYYYVDPGTVFSVMLSIE